MLQAELITVLAAIEDITNERLHYLENKKHFDSVLKQFVYKTLLIIVCLYPLLEVDYSLSNILHNKS